MISISSRVTCHQSHETLSSLVLKLLPVETQQPPSSSQAGLEFSSPWREENGEVFWAGPKPHTFSCSLGIPPSSVPPSSSCLLVSPCCHVALELSQQTRVVVEQGEELIQLSHSFAADLSAWLSPVWPGLVQFGLAHPGPADSSTHNSSLPEQVHE